MFKNKKNYKLSMEAAMKKAADNINRNVLDEQVMKSAIGNLALPDEIKVLEASRFLLERLNEKLMKPPETSFRETISRIGKGEVDRDTIYEAMLKVEGLTLALEIRNNPHGVTDQKIKELAREHASGLMSTPKIESLQKDLKKIFGL
jgi:hypothetical protein